MSHVIQFIHPEIYYSAMMLVFSFARAQRSCFLVSVFVGLTFVSDQGEQTGQSEVCVPCMSVCYSAALATPCEVHPSEYAYRHDSVTRTERGSARYPASNLEAGGIHPEYYIHCDGTQLKLTDSDIGQEQYSSSDYYVWPAGRAEQLLFIFPTRVSLTTITLHYYSDSDLGFSRLRFYAVPDDFDVWDALSTGNPRVDVAAVQGRELTGHRNVSINVNFSTKKVLMYKYSSTYQFAVSEVEFFKCESK